MAATNWTQHSKLASDSSITEACLWARLTDHGQMASNHGRRREEMRKGRLEHAHHSPRCMSGRHGGAVPARPARGYPGKTSPQHHREHHTRRFHQRAHTPRPPRWCTACTRKKSGEVMNSEATGRWKPEWDPATDLLAEEAVVESVRWRRKRAQRGAFHPRWRQRSSPEAVGIAGRRQGD
jgi:hypothetical protein